VLACVNNGNPCPKMVAAGWEVAVNGDTDPSKCWVYESALNDSALPAKLQALNDASLVAFPYLYAQTWKDKHFEVL
jgi:hypothetical protein